MRTRPHSLGSGQRPGGAAGCPTLLRSHTARKYQHPPGHPLSAWLLAGKPRDRAAIVFLAQAEQVTHCARRAPRRAAWPRRRPTDRRSHRRASGRTVEIGRPAGIAYHVATRPFLAQYSTHYNGRRPHRALRLLPHRPDQPASDLAHRRDQAPTRPGWPTQRIRTHSLKPQLSGSSPVFGTRQVRRGPHRLVDLRVRAHPRRCRTVIMRVGQHLLTAEDPASAARLTGCAAVVVLIRHGCNGRRRWASAADEPDAAAPPCLLKRHRCTFQFAGEESKMDSSTLQLSVARSVRHAEITDRFVPGDAERAGRAPHGRAVSADIVSPFPLTHPPAETRRREPGRWAPA